MTEHDNGHRDGREMIKFDNKMKWWLIFFLIAVICAILGIDPELPWGFD